MKGQEKVAGWGGRNFLTKKPSKPGYCGQTPIFFSPGGLGAHLKLDGPWVRTSRHGSKTKGWKARALGSAIKYQLLSALLSHRCPIQTRPSRWHRAASCSCHSAAQGQAQNGRKSLVLSTSCPRRLGLPKGPRATSAHLPFPIMAWIPCWCHLTVGE